MNKTFQKAAASLIAFSTMTASVYADDYIFSGHCLLTFVEPEMDLIEFMQKRRDGESPNPELLNPRHNETAFAMSGSPRILVNEDMRQVQIVTDTSEAHGRSITIDRINSEDENVIVQPSLFDGSLITIQPDDGIVKIELSSGISETFDFSAQPLLFTTEMTNAGMLQSIDETFRVVASEWGGDYYSITIEQPHVDDSSYIRIHFGEDEVSASFFQSLSVENTSDNAEMTCYGTDANTNAFGSRPTGFVLPELGEN